MRFQAPPEVSALSCAGEDLIPDARGFFETDEARAAELRAHGCVPAPAEAAAPRGKKQRKAD